MDLKERFFEGFVWINPAQDRDGWQDLGHIAVTLSVLSRTEILTNRASVIPSYWVHCYTEFSNVYQQYK